MEVVLRNAVDTRAALVKSAKEEFLQRGFEKASLRTICANAKVTTGAFYAHFKKKDELFDAVVEDDLSDYLRRYDGLMERLTARVQTSADTEVEFMNYLLERRDLFKLLFDCSEGTKYEGFKEQLVTRFEESYQRLFDSYSIQPIDCDITKLVVKMKFSQYIELLYGDYSKERVREVMRQIQKFTQAGFEVLMGAKLERPT